jgi:hypothetical protein
MRLLRLAVCVLFLVGALVAQTTPPSSSESNLPDPNQKPENPLQDAVKPTEEEQRRVEQRQRDAAFEGATAGKQDQFIGEIRLMTRNTDLHGDKTRSFRDEGENNLAEINLFSDNRFQVTRRVQTLMMYRGTDDSSIDPEHNSIQKGYVRFFGPRDEYIFGDTLVNFSRLSFNQNIKGASAAWKLGETWKLNVVSGIFIDRWGSLYNEELLSRPFRAWVNGVRLENRPTRDLTWGVNFSSSNDADGSRPFEPFGTGIWPADNRMSTFDLKWQAANGLRFDGEFGYSSTDFDTRGGLGHQGDLGGRAEASWRYKRLSLRGSYLRYEPEFVSINARQLSDLQDMMARASYELTDWLIVDGLIRRTNDDLENQKPYERRLLGPEARLTFHDLPFYRRMTIDVGYRHRDIEGIAPAPIDCLTPTTRPATTICVDRYVRMPFIELNLPVKTTYFGFGYERRGAVDRIDPVRFRDPLVPGPSEDLPGGNSNTDRYFASLRGMYSVGGWHVNPNLRFEIERGNLLPGFGVCRFCDSNRLGSATLWAEAPRWFIFEAAYRNTTATTSAIDVDPITFLVLTSASGYHRPQYRGAMTYKVRNDENVQFILHFERNNNFYVTSPDYDERVYGLTFVYKFGKRG